MTRVTRNARLITTEELYKLVTGAQSTVPLKGKHPIDMLNRFMIRDLSSHGFLLLDVRSCMEVERSGMILGAQVLPSYYLYYAFTQSCEKFEANFGINYPEKRQNIVCYADDGPRASNAHTTLSYLGYRNVRIYKDGIDGFRKLYPHLIGKLPVD